MAIFPRQEIKINLVKVAGKLVFCLVAKQNLIMFAVTLHSSWCLFATVPACHLATLPPCHPKFRTPLPRINSCTSPLAGWNCQEFMRSIKFLKWPKESCSQIFNFHKFYLKIVPFSSIVNSFLWLLNVSSFSVAIFSRVTIMIIRFYDD